MKSKYFSSTFLMSLIIGAAFIFSIDTAFAKMGKRFKDSELKQYHKKSTSNVQGEISQIRPDYIGVITAKATGNQVETETIFVIDEDVVFKSKQLDELAEGDKVKVIYENVTEPDPDDPGEDKFVQRVTKEIQYLSPKSKSLKSGKKK